MDRLDRLYHHLVETLRSRDPDGTSRTITIAELYQHIIPFRAVRFELGFQELAEYERALLRLLAGEREYVLLETDAIQQELRRELEAPNPILGLYRDYASAKLRLNPHVLPAAQPPATDSAAEPSGELDTAPDPLPLLEDDADPLPWLSDPEPADGSRCWHCRAVLPPGVEVRFCPSCGVLQQPVPCAGCQATLEPEWRYCIRCGLARQSQVP